MNPRYNMMVVQPVTRLSAFLEKTIESKIIDGFINGIGKAVIYSSRQIRLLQGGLVGSYILLMVVALVLFFVVQMMI